MKELIVNKLIVISAGREIFRLYRILYFITAFTRYLSCATSVQPTPSCSITLIPILILSYNLRLNFASNVFPSAFPCRCFTHLLSARAHCMLLPSHLPCFITVFTFVISSCALHVLPYLPH